MHVRNLGEAKDSSSLTFFAGEQSRAFEHPYFNQLRRDGAQFQEMRVSADSGERHLNIVSCNPDAFKVGVFFLLSIKITPESNF